MQAINKRLYAALVMALLAVSCTTSSPTHIQSEQAPKTQDCIDQNYNLSQTPKNVYEEHYINTAKQRITRVGNLNASFAKEIMYEKHAILQLHVDRAGILKEVKATSPSCSAKANEEFIRIVRLVSPFNPLTRETTANEFIFEIKIKFTPSTLPKT